MHYTNDDETFNDGIQPHSLMDLYTETAANDQHTLGSDVEISNDSPSSSNILLQKKYTKEAKLEVLKTTSYLYVPPL